MVSDAFYFGFVRLFAPMLKECEADDARPLSSGFAERNRGELPQVADIREKCLLPR
jgi:hypothetical protein